MLEVVSKASYGVAFTLIVHPFLCLAYLFLGHVLFALLFYSSFTFVHLYSTFLSHSVSLGSFLSIYL